MVQPFPANSVQISFDLTIFFGQKNKEPVRFAHLIFLSVDLDSIYGKQNAYFALVLFQKTTFQPNFVRIYFDQTLMHFF